MAQNPNYQTLVSFAARLKSKEPAALATFMRLRDRCFAGDPAAARALQKISATMRSPQAMAAGYMAIGTVYDDDTMMGAIPVFLANLGHLGGRLFGTAGNVLQKTGAFGGALLSKTGTLAAKPFHFVETKLGGKKSIAFLPPHVAVPIR
jgi:hypothetical protein